MRRFIVLSLLSTSLFAQWDQPKYRADKLQASSVIVEFRDPPLCERTRISAKAAKAEYDAAFRRFRSDTGISSNIAYEYYELFNGVALTATPSQIASIRQLPYVKQIHTDFTVHALASNLPANVAKIKADQVWSTYGTRGRGVTVAIIDTGIDYTHPALGGGFGPGFKVIGGYNFVSKTNDPMDDHFHGTHVAGIVAGDSDDLLGVAPDVSLLAYKVLDSHGSGKTSDVLAGIERAADPNSDGDFSDHADVANLSLGGLGNPDDPQSMAIDRGTALGVVYCVAAGNSGSGFHTIGSPGTARSAITVGASDNNDVIAFFSSRGPNTKDAGLKPDVIAPGVSVVSSLPGAKYGPLSGTSMATPHVAGVAALVKAVHRDWTADQIKSAIIDSANFLNLDMMIQGGGRADALAAAGTATTVTPGSISLGLDKLTRTTWNTDAMLHVTNTGTKVSSYRITTASLGAVSISFNPSQLLLEPGASADVDVLFSVTNSQLIPTTSLAFGGTIAISNTTTSESLHVPWASVKAARVLLSYDKVLPETTYIDRATGTLTPSLPIDITTQEAFLAAGAYDMLVLYEELDVQYLINTGQFRDSDLRVHYVQGQTVTDDATITLNSASASHQLTLNAQNEKGEPLVSNSWNGYASVGRIVLPAGSKPPAIVIPAFPSRTWHVTDLDAKLLLEELNYDFNTSQFYLLQHTPLDGVHGDSTLTVNGSELKRASISAALAPAQTGDQRIVLFVVPIVPPPDTSQSLGLVLRTSAPSFNMSLFINPAPDPAYSLASVVGSITDGVTRYQTPAMRLLNGRIIATTNGTNIAPWQYTGEDLIFGNGLHFPRTVMLPGASSTKPNLLTDFVGQLGETRFGEHATTVTTLYGSDSSVINSGSFYPMTLDLSQPGRYTIKAVDTGLLAPGIPRTSTVTSTVDSSQTDFIPPSFTTMMLLDANGRLVTHLDSHGGGSIVFGGGDFTYTPTGSRTYQGLAGNQTKAWYRRSGTEMWEPLTATQIGEDALSGVVYRADLANAANADNVLLDMKFDLVDAAGNTTSFVMEPAFAVGRDSFFGRRSPHR
jgi:subtilisin family serine protease